MVTLEYILKETLLNLALLLPSALPVKTDDAIEKRLSPMEENSINVSGCDVKSLMALDPDQLKACLKDLLPDDVQTICDALWENIRGQNLRGGQPRNASSRTSVEFARLGLSIAVSIDKPDILAEAQSMMAYALNADEHFEESLEYYERAIETFDRSGKELKAAQTRLGMMMALSMLGRSKEAIQVGQRAEVVFQQRHDLAGQARLAVNMGIAYQGLDEHGRALERHMNAAEVFESLGNDRALAQCYLNIANVLSLLDRFEDAQAMYDKCEHISRNLGLDDFWRQALHNKAYLHFLRGRFNQALTLFSQIRQEFAESGSDRYMALCDLNSAEIYLQMNLPIEAARLAKQVVEVFKGLNIRYEHAKALVFFGVTLAQNRQFADAIEVFRSAHVLFTEEKNTYWTAVLELYRAEILLSLGRFWEARALAVSADEKFAELGLIHKTAASLVVRGHLALKLGLLSEAQSLAEKVAALSEEGSHSLVERFPCSLFCAKVAEQAGEFERSRQYYEKAAREIETQHNSFLHHDLRMTFFNGKQEVYRALVTLSLTETADEGAAFVWCERAKARQVIDVLQHHLPTVRAHSDHTLLSRINHLRDELNSRYLQLRTDNGELPTLSRSDSIDSKETELTERLREMADIDPEYVSLQSGSVADVRHVQAALPQDSTLLEYFVAGDEVLAFVVTREGLTVFRHLCPLSRVDYLTERLHSTWRTRRANREVIDSTDPGLLATAREILGELYAGLVAPLAESLQGTTLFIVPHGMMYYLPFHAFYDGASYLTDRFDIVYEPSGSVLKHCMESAQEAQRENPSTSDRMQLRTDGKLTRDSFVEQMPSANRIHISAESLLRYDSPVFSGFKVTDGWITALDLFSASCSAALVTLSGATSEINRDGRGEDVVAVQRGWLYAGAQSILMRLWNAEEGPTEALLSAFNQHWEKMQSNKAEALRLAMRDVRTAYPNPYHWAPFVLCGRR